ncbi:hypothetical protein D3C86_1570410 [compost metagenome]
MRRDGGADQLRHHIPFQGFEGFTVAEEVGDTDQHIAQQCLGFLGVTLQKTIVAGEVRLSRHLHPAFDPAQYGGAFVVFEIMAGAGAQLDKNVLQPLLGHHGFAFGDGGTGLQFGIVGGRQADCLGVAPQFQQFLRHFDHGQHQVYHARVDGCTGHAVELGVFRCLGEGDAALFLDTGQTDGTVRTGT